MAVSIGDWYFAVDLCCSFILRVLSVKFLCIMLKTVGSGMMPGQSDYMPFKLNMAGVIPPIFASSIILFPSTLLGWFGSKCTNSVLQLLLSATRTALLCWIICNNYYLLLLFLYCFSI